MRLRTTLFMIAVSPVMLFAQPDRVIEEMSLEELLNVEVTTASKVKERLTEAPATVYVITAEDIERRGYTSLLEVLEDIPEFEIQERNNAENYGLISARGIPGQDHLLILMDGARINSMAATFHAVGENYNVRQAERIEILMGPASAIYGADAFSGVINIITKTGDKVKGGEAYASYGQYNTTDNSILVGAGNEDFSVAAGGSFYRTDDPYLPKYYPQHFQWYTDQYLNGANVLASPFSQDTVSIAEGVEAWNRSRMAYTAHCKMMFRDVEVGVNYSSFDYSTSNGTKPEYSVSDKDAFYGIDILTLYGKHTWESRKKRFSVENQLITTMLSLNPMSSFHNSFSNYVEVYKYVQNRGSQWATTVNFQINDKNRLTGGLNYKVISALPKTSDLPVPYDRGVSPVGNADYYYPGSNVVDTNGRDLTLLQDFYFFNEHTLGGSVQYQSNVQDKLFLTVGGRVDYNTRYGWTVNPRAGLVMMPVDNFRIRLSYGEALLSPSPEATYQHYGAFFFNQENNRLESFFFRLPNANLKPTKLRSGELNFNYLKGDISFSLGGFYNAVANLPAATYVSDTTFKGAHIYTAEVYRNVSSQKTYGGSIRVEYRKHINNDMELSTYGSFSYIAGQFGDLDMPYTAPYSAKIGAFFRWNKFSISLRGLYRSVSESQTVLPEAPSTLLPGETYEQEGEDVFVMGAKAYFMLNAFVKYRIIDPGIGPNSGRFTLEVFAKVRNATNAKYYQPGYGSADVFSAVPQNPITFTAGVFVRFAKK